MASQEVRFREALLTLSDLLGSSAETLTARVGLPDDVSQDEHRAFVWFRPANAGFRIKDGRVDHLTIPIADAAGNPYAGPAEYFELDGVRLGMTKEEVLAVWGQPEGQSNRAWSCKTLVTPEGKRVTLAVGFNEGDDGVLRVHQFSTRPAEPQAKSGCFGVLAGFVLSAAALAHAIVTHVP